jgi:hypothetical protein
MDEQSRRTARRDEAGLICLERVMRPRGNVDATRAVLTTRGIPLDMP